MERLTLFTARINAGVVEIEQDGEFKPASDALKLVAGEADSTGFVIIGEAIALYFANTQPDLVTLIDKTIEAIDQTIAIANQLVVKVAAGPSVPLDATAAANLEVIKTELAEFKPI